MRPVNKVLPGDTVSYMDSQGRMVTHVVKSDYSPYGEAKLPLVGNIGRYCSYCENCLNVSNLEVEHILPKSQGGPETEWNNFLLGCKVCNCNKGTVVINPTNCHFPHLNNTFLSLVYDETGRVKVNPDLPPRSKSKAENLMKLTQLDRQPSTSNIPSPKDYRWHDRYKTWNLASRAKELYQSNRITVDDVIDQAKSRGYWSIWFTVFSGIDAVLSRLISDFPGTCAACFDPNNHYAPIERNPGETDPV